MHVRGQKDLDLIAQHSYKRGMDVVRTLNDCFYQQSNLLSLTIQIYFIIVVRKRGQLSLICTVGERVTPHSLTETHVKHWD